MVEAGLIGLAVAFGLVLVIRQYGERVRVSSEIVAAVTLDLGPRLGKLRMIEAFREFLPLFLGRGVVSPLAQLGLCVADDLDLVRGERRQRVGDREQRIRIADPTFCMYAAQLEPLEIGAHPRRSQAAGAAVMKFW